MLRPEFDSFLVFSIYLNSFKWSGGNIVWSLKTVGTSSIFLVHAPRSGKAECLHTFNHTEKKSKERRDDPRNKKKKSLDCSYSTMWKRKSEEKIENNYAKNCKKKWNSWKNKNGRLQMKSCITKRQKKSLWNLRERQKRLSKKLLEKESETKIIAK